MHIHSQTSTSSSQLTQLQTTPASVKAVPKRIMSTRTQAAYNGNGNGVHSAAHTGNGTTVMENSNGTHLNNGNGNGHKAATVVVSFPGDHKAAADHGNGYSTTTILPIYTPDEVFVCPEESLFYSQSIEKLVMNKYVCNKQQS